MCLRTRAVVFARSPARPPQIPPLSQALLSHALLSQALLSQALLSQALLSHALRDRRTEPGRARWC